MKQITLHSNLDRLEDEGLFDTGIQRELSTQELASYAQAAPELAHVFDAMIGNHDEPLSPEQSRLGSMRVA